MSFAVKPYLRSVSIDRDAKIDYDYYPFNIPAVKAMNVLEMDSDVTFFVGENGAGKSTILEAIAVALGLPSEGGPTSINRTQQEVSSLQKYLKLIRGFRRPSHSYFLRAESMFNVFSYMDLVGGSIANGAGLHHRSHGEAFADLLRNFQKGGLYLLDEPEAALSPNRQLAALCMIDQLVKQDAQFIIATHSPILLAYPRATIYSFDTTGVGKVAYEDTEHYSITRDFLNNYPRRLSQLLSDE